MLRIKLEQENKELKKLLSIAELRAEIWQYAIEVAGKKLDIDICKKVWCPTINSFQKQRPKTNVNQPLKA